jgi:hypothetical protein
VDVERAKADLDVDLAAVTQRADEAEAARAALASRLTEVERAAAALRIDLAAASRRAQVAEEARAELTTRLEALQADTAALGLDLAAAIERADASEAAREDLAARSQRLDEANALLSAELAAARERAETSEAARADLDRRLQERDRDITYLSIDLQAANARAESAEATTAELALRIEEVRRAAALEAFGEAWGPSGALRRRWRRLEVDHARTARALAAPFRLLWRTITAVRLRSVGRNPLFDADRYLLTYPDARSHAGGAWRHYREVGSASGWQPNECFDPSWYRARYPDVAASGMEPLDHYYLWGAAEGRDPGPEFSTTGYLAANPDVLKLGIHPLLHYLRHGRFEGRRPSPPVIVAAGAMTGTDVGEARSFATPVGRSLRDREPEREPGMTAPVAARRPDVAVRREDHLAAVRTVVDGLPDRTGIVVASPRDEALLAATRGRGTYLADGGTASEASGSPASIRATMALVEAARWEGAGYLLLPRGRHWGEGRDPAIESGLSRRYRRLEVDPDAGSWWSLQEDAPLRLVDDLVGGIWSAEGRPPTVLDWSGTQGLQDLFPTCSVQPVGAGVRDLPYLDSTFDLVIVDSDEDRVLAAARRVASSAVVGLEAGKAVERWRADPAHPGQGVSVLITLPPSGEVSAVTVRRVCDGSPSGLQVELIVVQRRSRAVPSSVLAAAGGRDVRSLKTVGSLHGDVSAAARLASHDLLAIVGGATALLPGWIQTGVDALAARPTLDAVTGMVLARDGAVAMCGAERLDSATWSSIGAGSRDADDPRLNHVRPVDGIPLEAAILRRESATAVSRRTPAAGIVAAKAGLYDPSMLAIRPLSPRRRG